MTATCTEPATPPSIGESDDEDVHGRASIAGPPDTTEGRLSPALLSLWCYSRCYPVVTFVPSTVGFCPNT